MTGWTAEELRAIGAADELEIAAAGADGELRPYVTIWVIRVDDDLYVRSYRGRDGAWFRAALRRPAGRVRAAGIERDVSFEQPGDDQQDAIDHAYRDKYARYPASYVEPMVAPDARAATLRLSAR